MTMMKTRTGLEFATGTTEACKRLVARLCPDPKSLLDAYREARQSNMNGDLVVGISATDPSRLQIDTRADFVRRAVDSNNGRVPELMSGLAQFSAHQVARLPVEEDAMWFVVLRRREMPVMCVIFAAPYQVGEAVN